MRDDIITEHENVDLWEVLVPVHMYGPMPFTTSSKSEKRRTFDNVFTINVGHHEEFDRFIKETTNGGLTLLNKVKGQWYNGTVLEHETMIPVRFMACSSKALDIAKFARFHYDQSAILMYKISDCLIMQRK
tara:strand:- start:1545 stop:1937 length:393 start_codon:yes stop_codon:yes gene_type:complete